jgi:hypothetical protein
VTVIPMPTKVMNVQPKEEVVSIETGCERKEEAYGFLVLLLYLHIVVTIVSCFHAVLSVQIEITYCFLLQNPYSSMRV